MLARFVLYSALAVLGFRWVTRLRWREFGRRVDRLVNAILIALVIVYSGQLVWWLVFGKG